MQNSKHQKQFFLTAQQELLVSSRHFLCFWSWSSYTFRYISGSNTIATLGPYCSNARAMSLKHLMGTFIFTLKDKSCLWISIFPYNALVSAHNLITILIQFQSFPKSNPFSEEIFTRDVVEVIICSGSNNGRMLIT